MMLLDAHVRHRILMILTEGLADCEPELRDLTREAIAAEVDRMAERLMLQGLAAWRRPADGIGETAGTA